MQALADPHYKFLVVAAISSVPLVAAFCKTLKIISPGLLLRRYLIFSPAF